MCIVEHYMILYIVHIVHIVCIELVWVILKNVTQTILIKFIFFILTSNCFLGDFVAVVYDKCLNVYLFLFLQ